MSEGMAERDRRKDGNGVVDGRKDDGLRIEIKTGEREREMDQGDLRQLHITTSLPMSEVYSML